MNICQMFVTMKKRTDFKAGHMGQKLGHWVKSEKNYVYSLAGTDLIQSA